MRTSRELPHNDQVTPKEGGFSHRRCHAAGSRTYMGRLRAATGSGSGAGRSASGLPQVGAVLLRLLPQIRSFPSRSHQPWPFSRQARIQKPGTCTEEPGFRRCSAAHPSRALAGPNTSFGPICTCCQTTHNARPEIAGPAQCPDRHNAEGHSATPAAAHARANSRATPGRTPGPVKEVRGFLSDLAVRQGVAASTQNQAFGAVEG